MVYAGIGPSIVWVYSYVLDGIRDLGVVAFPLETYSLGAIQVLRVVAVGPPRGSGGIMKQKRSFQGSNPPWNF